MFSWDTVYLPDMLRYNDGFINLIQVVQFLCNDNNSNTVYQRSRSSWCTAVQCAIFTNSSTDIPWTVSVLTMLECLSLDNFLSSTRRWLANVTDSCCSADYHKQQRLSHFITSHSKQMTMADIFHSWTSI